VPPLRGGGFEHLEDTLKRSADASARKTMMTLADQRVLVLGLGASGQAACRLLRQHGARVVGVDNADHAALRTVAAELQAREVTVHLGMDRLPPGPFDLAVLSPGVPYGSAWVGAVRAAGIPIISELELGYRQSRASFIAITGTNGKTTTTELVEQVLRGAQRKAVVAGNIGLPLCTVAAQSPELEHIVVEISSFQLETIEHFRPTIAVLMNLTPDHLDRYADMADYVRAKARLFRNQQPYDWAVVQGEALAQLRQLEVPLAAQLLTFSAADPRADIYLESGRIQSRISWCSGPWLALAQSRLVGPHNAENLMAALAVGRILRLPWPAVVAAIQQYQPAPHRCELVAEIGGIQFINDSKATNVDAVAKALLTVRPGKNGVPNVWLIAGGKDKGFDFAALGPLLAQRVKGVFLMGETRKKIQSVWERFAPCTPADSLLEAVTGAVRKAVSGDVVLLSPACSSFDMFQNYQHRGEVFRQAVTNWARQNPPVAGRAG
jgi:UDP-N-acetylmuramoylalanine--D-glutamate ligase